MQKITTFLTFDNRAEEAVQYYTSIFKDSKVLNIIPGPDGSVMGMAFQLDGQEFMALNGGPNFAFAPGMSLFVKCETQEEIDELWTKLSAGGQQQPCGWLQDKFGVSWQIVPPILGELLQSKEPGVAPRVMESMLAMSKIDIAALKQAAAGE